MEVEKTAAAYIYINILTEKYGKQKCYDINEI